MLSLVWSGWVFDAVVVPCDAVTALFNYVPVLCNTVPAMCDTVPALFHTVIVLNAVKYTASRSSSGCGNGAGDVVSEEVEAGSCRSLLISLECEIASKKCRPEKRVLHDVRE
jgi:hypothetical protein